jgi:hypothetical protein
LVARFVRDEEAVGSNPATPTTESAGQGRYPQRDTGPDSLSAGCGGPKRGPKPCRCPVDPPAVACHVARGADTNTLAMMSAPPVMAGRSSCRYSISVV